jgi:outer membrane receptor for ferric coprogen and ferric-rhodotorulic acid
MTACNYKVKGKAIPPVALWILPKTTWYLSYTEIYKPQSTRDASGNFLPPVIGSNYETGIKGSSLTVG